MNDYILNFGSNVHCYDDQCGKLAKVAFDSENRQVSNLVVEEGFLLKRARVFPFFRLERIVDNEIYISVHEDDLSDYPEYRETVVETLPEGSTLEPAIVQGSPYGLATSSPPVPMVRELIIEGVADYLDLIDKDTPLKAAGETVGRVQGLAVAPENGLITHILVHKGLIFVEEFWLSTLVVERISTKGVFVNMTKDELNELIKYDEEREYYWNRLPTDAVLENNAPDTDSHTAYTAQPRIQPHNSESVVSNEAALAAFIAEELTNDPRTQDAVIEVIHARGMVTLQGKVDDPEMKVAAEEITYAFPGVVSVTNELVVDPR